jgi:hypothetical protein
MSYQPIENYGIIGNKRTVALVGMNEILTADCKNTARRITLAGEGAGRTARVHVCEESDSGILPMNHSNKDGGSSAESEEGRLLIKENTFPSTTFPT